MVIAIITILVIITVVLGYTTFNLLKKQERSEAIIEYQQLYLDEINSVIKRSKEKLDELDEKGTFKADDEIGWFFRNVLYIQGILNTFLNPYEENATQQNQNQSQIQKINVKTQEEVKKDFSNTQNSVTEQTQNTGKIY